MITWSSSLSVGLNEIDGQHQQLIKLINDLNTAMSQGKSKDVLGGILTNLVAYTRTHFGLEERLFAQHGYPDAAAHKQQHEAFIQKVNDFAAKFQKGQLGVSIEIMTFLSDWLVKHIKGTDTKYAPFLKSKGVK